MATPETGLAPVPPSAAAAAPRFGEIYDRGYKHYDGPRLGRSHAIRALVTYSMKRALGIKKGVGAKIIPILLYVGVLLPVVIDVGIRAFLPSATVFADYSDFFGFIFVIEGIFVATIAPEMLCGDRRENVLPLYFSRALTRADYLLAKLLAAAVLTLTVSFLPAAILWLGRQLLEDSPLRAMGNNLGDLGRLALAGVLIALYLGAIGLLISSFTGRKSIAVGIIVLGFLIAEALAGALIEGIEGETDLDRYVVFLSPTNTVQGFVAGLFNEVDVARQWESAWVYGGVMAAIVLVCGAVMYWRYVPDE
ncbi:MAG: ABC transporter permease subunit [Chloroflexota bacterium]|nr:ABC transporter permease subunit [Chloroflexota bacterium]